MLSRAEYLISSEDKDDYQLTVKEILEYERVIINCFARNDSVGMVRPLKELVEISQTFAIPVIEETLDFPQIVTQCLIKVRRRPTRAALLTFVSSVVTRASSDLFELFLSCGVVNSLMFSIRSVRDDYASATFGCLECIARRKPTECGGLFESVLDLLGSIMTDESLSNSVRISFLKLLEALVEGKDLEEEKRRVIFQTVIGGLDNPELVPVIIHVVELLIVNWSTAALLVPDCCADLNHILEEGTTAGQEAVFGLLNKYFMHTTDPIPIDFTVILLLCQDRDIGLSALRTVFHMANKGLVKELLNTGALEVIRNCLSNGSYRVKEQAIRCLIAIVQNSSRDDVLICLENNAMEALVTSLRCPVEKQTFKKTIGAMTRLFATHSDLPVSQFTAANGPLILEELSQDEDPDIGTFSHDFLGYIRAL